MTVFEIDKSKWDEQGYLRLAQFLSPELREAVKAWVDELASWPETPGKWMKWYEPVNGARTLCRIEDFVPYHAGLGELLQGPLIRSVLEELLGEPAVLFKEKINFKLPGGAGFKPHQDAPAFTTFGQNYHVTVMVSVDETTVENGCLEVVEGLHGKGLLSQAPDGTLDDAWVAAQNWIPVETQPGDVLFFDSYVPHRSGPNRSDKPRRALYITYNRARDGSHRGQYFAHKRAAFPPECERVAGIDYSVSAATYNLGNPIV